MRRWSWWRSVYHTNITDLFQYVVCNCAVYKLMVVRDSTLFVNNL
jgi:hypothetical protein